MDAAPVMQAVALGTLDDVAQPLRRADVGVLEDRQERRCVQEPGDGLRGQAHERERQAAEEREADDVERAEVERPERVDPLGAVMHLVQAAPQPVRLVHRPVPGVDEELEEQHGGDGPDQRVHGVEVEEPVLRQALAPEERQVRGEEEIAQEYHQCPGAPARHSRQLPSREQRLEHDQGGQQGKQDPRDGVEQDLQRRRHGDLPVLPRNEAGNCARDRTLPQRAPAGLDDGAAESHRR
jgi:hypothetical protein